MYGEVDQSPAWIALQERVTALERRLNVTSGQAYAAQDRRFRLASSQLAVLVGAGQMTSVTVTFSDPMPSTDYQVDVSVSALLGQPVAEISASGKTVNGCTVFFRVPALLALGSAVTVLAVSGPVNP